jgi:hypothetical protein
MPEAPDISLHVHCGSRSALASVFIFVMLCVGASPALWADMPAMGLQSAVAGTPAREMPGAAAGTIDSVKPALQPVPRDPCEAAEINDDFHVDASAIGLFFLPALVRDQTTLKRYIRDPRFLALRRMCTDTAAADAIFLRALDIADGEIQYALLVALFGTMDHYRLGIRIPLLGVLNIPLTTESDSTFRVRYRNLPKRILPDSLGRTESDKDKLQHFFGSAFLAYFTHSRGLANMIGNMIETGEEAFVVGGANDDRDKFANRLGQEFGLRLLEGEELLPSDVLWHRSR